jgi:hypothetical protein
LTVAKRKNTPPESGSVVHLHVGDRGSGDSQQAGDDEIQQIDAMEDGELFRAIEEVRNTEGATAEVHRIMPAEKAGFCKRYPVSVFSHERIATDYGAGRYRVKFKGPGDKYIRGGGTFSIAESLNVTPAATGVSEVLALFKSERERDEQERQKRKGEWIEWAKLLAPLALPKILEMIGGGSKAPSLRDMVATMKDMKDLQAPQQDLTAQFSQVLGILEGAKNLVGDDSGSKVGSTWVDLLRDFLQSPAMGALASAIPGMASPPGLPSGLPAGSLQAPVNVGPPAPVASSGSAPGTAASSKPEADMLAQLNWLRGTLAQLLIQANKQANTRLYAEVVLDNLPPFVSPQELLEHFSADDWWTQLQRADSRIAVHAEWFGKFRVHAIKLLNRRLRAAQAAAGEAAAPEPASRVNQPMPEGDEFE